MLWLALSIVCTSCPPPLVLHHVYVQGYMRMVFAVLDLAYFSNKYKTPIK